MQRSLILILIGAVVLCFVALNNKFPLLTETSGIYLNAGFLRQASVDYVIGYGLFLLHSSWAKSLWLVILSQSVFVSVTIFYFFRYLSPSENFRAYFSACIFFVTFCMSASAAVSSISPNVFSAIAILSFGVLLFAKDLNRRDLFITSLIFALSVVMDASILVVSIILVVVYFPWTRSSRSRVDNTTKRRRLVFVFVLTIGSSVCLFMWQALLNRELNFSGKASVSMLPGLVEKGFAGAYLAKHCKQGAPVVCSCRDAVDSHVGSLGRFIKLPNDEREKIQIELVSRKITSEPHFWRAFIFHGLTDFIHQLGAIQLFDEFGDTRKHIESVNAIYLWFNEDVREHSISRQMQGWLALRYHSYLNYLSFGGCLIVFLILSLRRRPNSCMGVFQFFILTYVANALVNGVIYGSSSSQGYMSWVVAIPVFVFLSELSPEKWLNRRWNTGETHH